MIADFIPTRPVSSPIASLQPTDVPANAGLRCPSDDRGATVPEKSPQKPSAKKPGKTLKEKRDAKKEKKDNRPKSA